MRIIQISDTHLSLNHKFFAKNNEMLARWLSAEKPDLIIHTGDLSMDGAAEEQDIAYGMDWLNQFDAPIFVVPGNHDVGDSLAIRPDQPVNDGRLDTWRRLVGPDYWMIEKQGWRLIGLDAMLFSTGHPAEDAQFAWLEQASAFDGPVALFLHKPLFIDDAAEGPRGYWTVLPEARRRLLGLLQRYDVKLIGSGHLHIHRQQHMDGIDHVWCPAASFVVGPLQEDLGGQRTLGIIEHRFEGERVTSRFFRPDGLEDSPLDPVIRKIYPPHSDPQAAE